MFRLPALPGPSVACSGSRPPVVFRRVPVFRLLGGRFPYNLISGERRAGRLRFERRPRVVRREFCRSA